MKKKFIWIGGMALLLITGGAVVVRQQQTHSIKQPLLEVGRKGDHVYAQYRNADYQTAKQALLEHRHLLDQMSHAAPRPLNPYAVDAMLFTVRLAKLEEKHAGKEAPQYLQEAVMRCAKVGWAKCSEAKLHLTVDQIDAAVP